MRWGRWWGLWVPWCLNRVTQASKVHPTLPTGENQLQLLSPDREAGEGGHAEEFTPGLSLGEQPRLLPPQKLCLWWTVLTSQHLLWKWESSSSEFSVLSGARLWHPPDRVMGSEFTCIIPVSTLLLYWVLRVSWHTCWGSWKGLCGAPSLSYLEHELSLCSGCS